jgi:acetylornithine deacetylase/succinyl-diaminopimelate desuccinylase-like protein
MMRALFAQGRIDLDPDTIDGGPDDTRRLEEFVKGHPETDALMRNTFAVTTLSAGFKPNVIPAKAEGTVDCRILPGEDPDRVTDRVRDMLRDLGVRVEIAFAERPNGSPRGPLFDALSDAILSVHPDAVVLPYLSTGFTDSRFFRSIGVDTYGLMPVLLPREEFGRIHGVDERIPLAGIDEMVKIVSALIARWNG